MGPQNDDSDAANASLDDLLEGEDFGRIDYEPDFDDPDFARWYALDNRADADVELD